MDSSRMNQSAYTDRVENLSAMLADIEVTGHFTHTADELQNKVASLQQFLVESSETLRSKLNLQHEQLAALRERHRHTQHQFDQASLKLSKEADDFAEKAQELLQNFTLMQAKTKLERFAEDSAADLQHETHRELWQEVQPLQSLTDFLNARIVQVQQSVEREANTRAVFQESIASCLASEVEAFKLAVQEQLASLKQTEDEEKSLLETVHTQMINDIAEERQEREASEATLLKVFEEVCNKLDEVSN